MVAHRLSHLVDSGRIALAWGALGCCLVRERFHLDAPVQQCLQVRYAPRQTAIDSDWADRAVFEAGPLTQGLRCAVDCCCGLIRWQDFWKANVGRLVILYRGHNEVSFVAAKR